MYAFRWCDNRDIVRHNGFLGNLPTNTNLHSYGICACIFKYLIDSCDCERDVRAAMPQAASSTGVRRRQRHLHESHASTFTCLGVKSNLKSLTHFVNTQ